MHVAHKNNLTKECASWHKGCETHRNGEKKLHIQQVVREPCALCVLILHMAQLSETDKRVYERHLRIEHHMPRYHIER